VTGKIVRENLKHQPMRSLLSFLLIGVPVNLILCLVGLSDGMLDDARTRQRGIGADIIIRPTTASTITGSGTASIPDSVAEKIRETQPHVALAMGVIAKMADFPINIFGIDLDRFNQMSGGFQYLEGGRIQGPDDIIIDKDYAAQKKKHAGDTLSLMNQDWRISGVVEGGKVGRIFMEKKRLQELEAATGKVNSIYLKLDDPSRDQQVVRELQQAHPEYKIDTMESFTALLSASNVPALNAFRYVIMGIGVVIGFFVVSLSMYMAVLQRTREIGILKSMGAADGFVVRIILAEALVLGIGGTLMGIAMSFGSWWLIRKLVPASIPMEIVPAWWPIAGAITLTAAVLGGLYPGLKAAHHDTIQALAYE
jgi:putative ABC transport system permease protein